MTTCTARERAKLPPPLTAEASEPETQILRVEKINLDFSAY
jgi:hypothetical protein